MRKAPSRYPLIRHRVGSAIALKAVLNLVVRELELRETRRLFLNSKRALLRTSRRTILKKLSDCIGTRNDMRK